MKKAEVGTLAAVKAVVYNDSGQVLVLQKSVAEWPQGVGYERYDLPGGRLEYGEQLEDGLRRELWEETGLSIDRVCLLDAWTTVLADGRYLLVIAYSAHSVDTSCRLSDEHTAYDWHAPSQLLAGVYPSWIQRVVKKAVLDSAQEY